MRPNPDRRSKTALSADFAHRNCGVHTPLAVRTREPHLDRGAVARRWIEVTPFPRWVAGVNIYIFTRSTLVSSRPNPGPRGREHNLTAEEFGRSVLQHRRVAVTDFRLRRRRAWLMTIGRLQSTRTLAVWPLT